MFLLYSFFFPSSFPSPHKPLDNFPNFHSRCRVLRIATIDEHISHPLRDSGVPPRYGKTVKSYCELWTWKLASPASHVDIRMGGREAQRHVAHHLPTLQSLSRHVGYISATSAGTAPGQPSGWRGSWRRASNWGWKMCMRWFVMGNNGTVSLWRIWLMFWGNTIIIRECPLPSIQSSLPSLFTGPGRRPEPDVDQLQ